MHNRRSSVVRLEQVWREGIEKDTIIVVRVSDRGNVQENEQ